jgi:hypothetical protein
MQNIKELMEMMGSMATLPDAERLAELLAERGIRTVEDAREMDENEFSTLAAEAASEPNERVREWRTGEPFMESKDLFIEHGYEARIRWSQRGTCGSPGCTDPECGCGVAEDDPRWEEHGLEPCFSDECELCVDQCPLILFRGEGTDTQQARFHTKCYGRPHIRK